MHKQSKLKKKRTYRKKTTHSALKFQTGGGDEIPLIKSSTTTKWFHNTFLPYLTNECVHGSNRPEDIVAHMREFWDTHNVNEPLSKETARRMLKEFVANNTHNLDYKAYRYTTPTSWSKSKNQNALVGGGNPGSGKQLGCSINTNYAPYNYDNYDRWRGNAGASVPTGATIPQNPFQRIYNWFEGKTTILNPGNTNPTVQNQVNYLSQAPAKPIHIGSLQNPINVNMPSIEGQTTNGVVMPSIIENSKVVSVFPETTTTLPQSTYRQTPMARAGKRRRFYTRRRNKK